MPVGLGSIWHGMVGMVPKPRYGFLVQARTCNPRLLLRCRSTRLATSWCLLQGAAAAGARAMARMHASLLGLLLVGSLAAAHGDASHPIVDGTGASLFWRLGGPAGTCGAPRAPPPDSPPSGQPTKQGCPPRQHAPTLFTYILSVDRFNLTGSPSAPGLYELRVGLDALPRHSPILVNHAAGKSGLSQGILDTHRFLADWAAIAATQSDGRGFTKGGELVGGRGRGLMQGSRVASFCP